MAARVCMAESLEGNTASRRCSALLPTSRCTIQSNEASMLMRKPLQAPHIICRPTAGQSPRWWWRRSGGGRVGSSWSVTARGALVAA